MHIGYMDLLLSFMNLHRPFQCNALSSHTDLTTNHTAANSIPVPHVPGCTVAIVIDYGVGAHF